jgi:DNA-binding transcriptional LysR family regulator
LRYFLAVAETLNISEASRRLRVAQPSLSRQIRALEFEVGHPLFHRKKGRLSLTEAGAALRGQASKVVAQAESALRHARNAGSNSEYELRVGHYGTMWATVVAAALRQFRRHFPRQVVHFAELSPAQIIEDLRRGVLDVAVLGHGDAALKSDCVVLKIAPVAALIALSAENPLAKRRVISLAELRGQTFISYAPDYAPGRDKSFLQACRAAGFKPKMMCEAIGLPALLLAVAENRGLAVVSPFARRAPHPGVVFSKLKSPGVIFNIFVAYRKESPASAQRLAELIAQIGRRDVTSQFPG